MSRRARVAVAVVIFAIAWGAGPAAAQVERYLEDAERYFDEGELDKAARSYDRAIANGPGLVPPEAYGKRAAIFIIRKDYEAGLAFIADRAESQHPGAPEVLEQKALMLWLLGRRDDAIAVAEAVVAKKPDTYSNQSILGEFYTGRDPGKAIAAYEAYFRHRPSSLESGDVLPRVRLGFSYLAARRFRDAEAQFELLLKKHRDRPHAEVNANNGLCAAYTALGKYDRAITLCDRIVKNPRQVDRSGSVWYNLGRAYLAKRQGDRAREAGERYIKMRRNSPKGYLLVGDAYYQDRQWARALEYYLNAERLIRGGKRSIQLGIKLGATYRRLGRPDEAIAKLEAAIAVNPGDATLATELGNAYLDAKDDAKALATVDKVIRGDGFARLDSGDRSDVLVVSARSLYNQGKADEARQRYEAARALSPRDVSIRIGLVGAINRQAQQALTDGDRGAARQRLVEARQVDPASTLTNQNLAVLAIADGRCADAEPFLGALSGAGGDAIIYHRLMARSHLCRDKADPAKAAEHYAQAEKAALSSEVRANLLRAEIYTEWAPLLWDVDLDGAIAKLETAVQLSAQTPAVAQAAQRNLALALFRRGWRSLRANRAAAAAADFQIAARDPRVLRGTEPQAFVFSLAIAQLSRGNATAALDLFDRLRKEGGQSRYLAAPYASVGNQFFSAYAKYRSNSARLRAQAATELQNLRRRARGSFATKLDQILAGVWSQVAYDAYRGGNRREATRALTSAARYRAVGKAARIIEHNRAVLGLSGRGADRAESVLQSLSRAGVAEAQANLGILYDRQGKPRKAYDAWVAAKKRGVQSRALDQWIDAKRRILAYP